MATKKILAFRVEVEGVSEEAIGISKIEQELSKLNEERKESNRLLKEGKITRAQHVKQLALINSKTRDLKTSSAALAKAEKLKSQAFKASAGSMEQLRIRTAKLRAEANKLNLTTAQGKKRFQEIQRQVDKNAHTIRNFDRSMSGSKTLVGEYSRGIVAGFKAIAVGIVAAVAVVRTFQRVISRNVKTFAEFETSITNVQTLLDETNEMLVRESIAIMRRYGTEIEDTNKAMFDAISAGVETGEAFRFMNQAAILAIGGVTSMSSAVDGLTSIINAYGLEAGEAEKVASAFFSAQKFGKTTVAELSQSIGEVAPVAKLANVSYQELLSTYAELTKQGINTQLSNTAIKATILAVIKPSEQARQTFKRLGIEVGLNAVRQQGLFNILTKVSAAAEKNADELTQLIPNVRALTGVGALGEEQLRDYQEILATVNDDFGEGSSLINAYNIQMETANKRWDLAKSRVRELSIELGGKLAPALLTVMEALLPYTTDDPAILAAENLNIFKTAVQDLDREGQIAAVLKNMQGMENGLRNFRAESQALEDEQTFLKGIFKPKAWEEADRNTKFLNEQIIPQLEIGVKDMQALYDQLLAGGTIETPTPGEGDEGVDGGGVGIPIGPTASELAAFQLKMQKFYEKQLEIRTEKQKDALELQQEAIDIELRALDDSINKEIELEAKKWDRKAELRDRHFAKEKAEFLHRQEVYGTFSDALIQITNETIAAGELSTAKFGEIVVVAMLDLLRKIVLMKQVEILTRALASPASLATFGIAGLAKAAIINALVTAAFGAIKAKVSGKFAEGGQVQPGQELLGAPRGGDNTLIMAKPGEVILNRGQQYALGGPEVFRRAGVPGFAAGGVVPEPNFGRLEMPDIAAQITAAIYQIPVVLDMHEVREANDKLDVTAETTGV